MSAPRTLRLLVFMDTSTVSGPLRQLVTALDDLRRTHAVEARLVVCTRRGTDVGVMRTFLAAAGIDTLHLEERGRFDWRIIATYRRLLRDASVHGIQSHGYKPTIYLALLRLLGVTRPWVAFFHGRTYETRAVQLFDRLAIWCARFADRIVTVAACHQDLFPGRTSVRHIPNAITVAAVPRSSVVRPPDGPILYVGRLSPEKGVDLLVEAVAQLRREDAGIRLRLVGDGPARSAIEAQIRALDLQTSVELIGHVANPASHYAQARLLCLPSRSEGMPNVVLEALAAGLPVVATDVGDVRALVDPALGRVVPPAQVSALASALREELGTTRGAAFFEARDRLLQRFHRDTRARALRALYDELVPGT